MWAIVGVIALFALATLAALVLCAGGGAWSPDDEEPIVRLAHYESPEGFHRHRCDECGCIWEHADRDYLDIPSHRCPGCGRLDADDIIFGWPLYTGPSEPELRTP